MCWRLNKCKIAGSGCEIETANDCGLLKYIDQEIKNIMKKISHAMQEKTPFLYDEEWYKNLKSRATKIMSVAEFQIAEDKAIETFLLKQKNIGKLL